MKIKEIEAYILCHNYGIKVNKHYKNGGKTSYYYFATTSQFKTCREFKEFLQKKYPDYVFKFNVLKRV